MRYWEQIPMTMLVHSSFVLLIAGAPADARHWNLRAQACELRRQ